MFSTNGFSFTEGGDGRLQLSSVPFSRGTTFGAADVRELVALLDSGESAPMALGPSQSNTLGKGQQQNSVVRPSR